MQNQNKLSVIFLSFKSSHQVNDKQLHHLSKLLDQYFLWVNFHIAMMNKKTKQIWNILFQMQTWRKFLFLKKCLHLFTTLKSVSSLCYCLEKKKLWTIFLNLSSINAKSTLVCLAPIPTYFRQLEKIKKFKKIQKLF
jgi:hypothetical protein